MNRTCRLVAVGTLLMAFSGLASAQGQIPLAPIKYEDAPAILKELPAGKYTFLFVHPETCCPVEVCFEIKCGCFDVTCAKGLCAKKLVFNYKGCKDDFAIKFKKDGEVVVKD